MAAKGDITANVGISVGDQGLDKVIEKLNSQILGLTNKIASLGDAASNSNKKLSKKAEKDLMDMSNQIKALQRVMSQVDTLTKAGPNARNARNVLGNDLTDAALAAKVNKVNQFRRSLEESITVSEKLRSRINEITTETANMAKAGQQQTTARIRQQESLNKTLKEYEQFQTKLGQQQSKIGLLSPSSQKQVENLVLEAQRLKTVFADLAGDRRRFDFSFLTDAQKTITAELDKQIAALARQEKQEIALGEKTRQRAIDLLNLNKKIEQSQIEAQSRRVSSTLAPGTLSGVDTTARLERATIAYSRVKAQLEAAVANNASPERLNTLINRYESLRGVMAETIAAGVRDTKKLTAALTEEEQILKRIEAKQLALNNQLKRNNAGTVNDFLSAQKKALEDFDKQLGETEKKINPFQKAINGLLGDGGAGLFARVAIYGLAANAVFGLISTFKDGAKFVVEFEDKLAQLQAISSSTDSQMVKLSATILDVSKNSRFSATEIAEATIQLAQAGFSADDVGKSLQSITNFAAASGTGVKESVELITGALGAFQLQATDTARVTDVFTTALNRTRLSSQQIAQAIQYVGTTAYEQNISLEQMVATIGAVAQSGVKAGSTLGTGFRQFLVDLANPTEKLQESLSKLGLSLSDVDVKTKGLPAVLTTLKEAGFGAAQAYQGLEVRAAAFYLAAKNNIDISQQLMLAESQRGVALAATERAMDSLSAQTQRFYNILGAIAVDNAPLDFLKDLVKVLANAAESASLSGEALKKFRDEAKAGNKTDADWVAAYVSEFLELGQRAPETDGAVRRLLDTILGTSKASRDASAGMDALETSYSDAADAAAKQAQKSQSVNTELNKLILQGPVLRRDSIESAIQTNTLTSRFEGLASMLGTTANAYDNLVTAMRKYNAQQLQILGQKAGGEAAAARNQFTAYSDQANSLVGQIRKSGQLSGSQLRQFNQLSGQGNINTPGGLAALSDFAATMRGPVGKTINDLVQALSNRASAGGRVVSSTNLARDAALQSNPIFRKAADSLSGINALIGQRTADSTAQSPAERAAAFAPVTKSIDTLSRELDSLVKKNINNPVALRNLQGLQGELSSARRQVQGIVDPSKKETKQAEREAKAAEALRKRQEREAQRAADKYAGNELTASSMALRAADKTLQSGLTDQRLAVTLSQIPALLDTTQENLTNWIEKRRNVLTDQISKAGMTPDQIKTMTDAANEEIAAKEQQVIQTTLQGVDKSISGYVTRRGKSIEREFKESTQAANDNIARQEGLNTGLNNYRLSGRVTTATKTIQGRQVEIANDNYLRETYAVGGAADQRIEKYNEDIASLGQQIKFFNEEQEKAFKAGDTEKARAYGGEIVRLNAQVDDLVTKSNDLAIATTNVRSQFDAASLAPKNFRDGISQAAQAFRINNDVGISASQRVINGLGGVLDEAHGSFQTFFTDVISGTQSVGAAFGSMAKAVIGAILEMAAKAVATQIFGLLLSFIPGSAPKSGGINNVSAALGRYNGGPIGGETPKRLIGGGAVSGGLPTRDSVLVHAAKGEFMMKRSSVESIGQDLLQDMNNRGAAAFNKLRGGDMIVPQSRFNSNVYVMLPEEQPQVGPNDIIATINRDILRGGPTKQLIKQVSAGA